MKVHLVDGTYELFRNYFGAPPKKAPDGREVGATVGLLRSLLALVSTPGATPGVTHVAVAFDHVIESFRNDLYPGYKTSTGVAADLLQQFPLAEKAVAALGIVVWPMVELEADDALATAAGRFKDQRGVEQVVICSPDKDLAQTVTGQSVICWDRRRDVFLDEEGVIEKFGVRPLSIPDWLALVGDAADGYPGVPGWGAKSAAAVLRRFEHLEAIPPDARQLGLPLQRATRLVDSLAEHREEVYSTVAWHASATMYRCAKSSATFEWRGAGSDFEDVCRELGEAELAKRVIRRRDRDLLAKAYAAFNARDIDAVLAVMHPDVDWPNAWEGGRVHGQEGVREYWQRQWAATDPHVDPVGLSTDEAGHIVVTVHQMVRDLEGNVSSDGMVAHVYLVQDGLVRSMEVRGS